MVCVVRPALALALLAVGCAPAAAVPSRAHVGSTTAVAYEVHAHGPAPCTLDVEARIEGGADALVAEFPRVVVASLEVEDAGGARVVMGQGGRFPIACASSCRVRYRLDLDATAAAADDAVETAFRTGRDVLAPASTWLLHPARWAANVPVSLRVATDPGLSFAAGLHAGPEAGTYVLRSQELATAGYTAFGPFSTARVDATGGVVDVAWLGGPRDASEAEMLRWIAGAARSLDEVYGRFPVARAQLFVVTEPGSDDVEFGRTLPSGGASTVVVVGEHAGPPELARDWILTHELFHLGVPSFWREGRWIDEGLATYYEPVVRARTGALTPRDVWDEMAEGLPRGVPADARGDLEHTDDHDRIYWGGALFVLRADVEIRRRTGGRRSLDDGLRAVLAGGGDATRLWSLAYFLQTIDDATGVPVMKELTHQLERGEGVTPAALRDVLAALGVAHDEHGVHLSDDAPLAGVRLAILRGDARVAGLAPEPR